MRRFEALSQPDMIRVNLGFEHIDDIKHNFEQALTMDFRSPIQLRRWWIGLRLWAQLHQPLLAFDSPRMLRLRHMSLRARIRCANWTMISRQNFAHFSSAFGFSESVSLLAPTLALANNVLRPSSKSAELLWCTPRSPTTT